MALLIRREVDELSQADLTALRQAFIDLGWGNEGSRYTRLVAIYGLPLPMLSVHHRPQFLAWNRAYLALFERALGLPLPWWDFTSERTRSSGIPAAFAEETVNDAPNPLFRGPFQGVPESQWRSALAADGPMPQFTSRTPGQEVALPETDIVERVLDTPSFKDFQDFAESVHDQVHVWVGGAVGTIPLAAYDPFIWPLNAAIDRLWWLWQRAHPDAELPDDLLAGEVRPFGRTVADLLDVRRLGYTYPEVDAAAPVSVMAGYSADTPAGPDSLQVGSDVRTLCTLLAARAIEPPISIGLFGDWGSGKTFFMAQMQQRIRLLAAESRRARELQRESAFCTDICQITFNAWHYADTELWPSLASHIFESMASPEARGLVDPDEAAILQAREEQAGLARKLAQARVHADMLAARATQSSARDEIERLSSEFAEAAVNEVVPDAQEDLRWLGERASVELPDAAETSVDDMRRLVRTGSLVRQLWRELPIRGWVAVVFLVVAVAVVLAAWLVASRVAGPIAGLAASLALSVGTVLAVAAGPLRVVAQTASRVNSVLARIREREAERRRELRRRREAADRRIAELQRDIAALESGRQLYDFAQQRSASADYLERIGVIGLIRRDFDRMSQLLRRQPPSRSAGDDALPRIDRIVLYIDDLDRCSPAQVVQVLEAVHLLLAMPLFAVVVGVDVRWLVRSLQQRRVGLDRGDAWTGGAVSDPEGWSATAMNYMEKIFQIPYTLRPMSKAGYQRMIERLVPLAPAAEASAAQAAPTAGDTGSSAPGEAEGWLLPLLPVPDVEDERVDLTPRGLVIQPAEQDFMKLLSAFIPTPRAAKRLTNTYRLIRASLDPAELDRIVASGDYRVVLTLLGVMVGYTQAAADLFRRLAAARGGVRWCDLVDDGGAKGQTAGWSFDGGRTWGETPQPYTKCAQPFYKTQVLQYERTSDPWVSIGPDGTAYGISLPFDGDFIRNGMGVAVSHDGGRTWTNQQDIDPLIARADTLDPADDKESVTADPNLAGWAYGVWDRIQDIFPPCPASAVAAHAAVTVSHDRRSSARRAASTAAPTGPQPCPGLFTGPTYFSRTRDGGKTWETPRLIVPTGVNEQTIGNEILINRKTGVLYDFFNFIKADGSDQIEFVFSTDHGTTWSGLQFVQRLFTTAEKRPFPGCACGVVFPGDATKPLRTGDIIPAAAIDPNTGQLYVIWQDGRPNNFQNDMLLASTSTAGGAPGTWSTPTLVNPPTDKAAFTAAISVDGRGRVGVTYYDFTPPLTTPDVLLTDTWFTSTSEPGLEFGPRKLIGGPFNMEAAPIARGFFVGDYIGLAARTAATDRERVASEGEGGGGFVPLFVMTNCADNSCRAQGTIDGSAKGPDSTDVFTRGSPAGD